MTEQNLPEHSANCLLPDEHVLWWGQPSNRVLFPAERISIFVFRSILTVYLVLWSVLFLSSSIGIEILYFLPYLTIFLTPFVIFFAVLLISWRKRKKDTVFLITNMRALDIFYEGKKAKTIEKPLSEIHHFEIHPLKNGASLHLGKYKYINFGKRYCYTHKEVQKAHRTGNAYFQNYQAYFNQLDYLTFFDLENYKEAERLIRELTGAEEHIDHKHAF